MWQQVYQTKFHNAKELNHRMLDMSHSLKQSVIDDAQLTSVVNVPVHVFVYCKTLNVCVPFISRISHAKQNCKVKGREY